MSTGGTGSNEPSLIAADGLDAGFVPHQHSAVASIELDGEAVLYDDITGALHVLNPSASVLWACFDGTGTIGELADDLAEAYSVDREQVLADALETARQLGRAGLLEGVAREGEYELHDHHLDDAAAPVAEPAPAEPRFLTEPPST